MKFLESLAKLILFDDKTVVNFTSVLVEDISFILKAGAVVLNIFLFSS